MKSLEIKFGSIRDAKKFCEIANKKEYRINIVSGSYTLSAKSIISILCFDLLKPITLEIDCSDLEYTELTEQLSEFQGDVDK